MTETQVSSFVTKFGDLLHAGLKASLVMDCDNGHARLNLEVILEPDSHQYQSRAGVAITQNITTLLISQLAELAIPLNIQIAEQGLPLPAFADANAE